MMESVIRLENFYFAYNKSELVLQLSLIHI